MDARALRLTNLWKPMAAGLVLLAAAIYAGLVAHEFGLRTQSGAERRAHRQAAGAIVEDEVLLGSVWAHRHHPQDANQCPNYSASFQVGCSAAVAARAAATQ